MYTRNISYALVQAASSCLRSFSPSNQANIYIYVCVYTLVLAPSICATLESYIIIITHTDTHPYIYAYSKSRPKLLFAYTDVQLDVTLYIYAICILSCIKYTINSTADRPGLTMQTGRVTSR